VPDLRSAVVKVKEAGYPIVTREDLTSAVAVDEDGLAYIPNQSTHIAFVMAPDGIKVELFENPTMSGDIALHHVHFASTDVAAMKAWYGKAFGAVPGVRGSFEAADLPGVNLTFSPSAMPVKPTRFKVLDHIGFEIEHLEEFCKQLAARGIGLDREYRYVEERDLGVAFVTDPGGTRIELTEHFDTH
jgi:catechol 2,3-dioxygenase-like lactoylglutathione lyase family enzyme